MADSGRRPGPTRLASLCTSPNWFGYPTRTVKSSVSLFRKKPARATTAPDPKIELIVVVIDTALPRRRMPWSILGSMRWTAGFVSSTRPMPASSAPASRSRGTEGGPADEAGLQKSDVIRAFDGTPIEEFDDLPRVVASTPVGKKVKIVVVRDGERVTLRPKIAQLEEPEAARIASAEEPDAGAGAFGMRVQDLTEDLAQQLGLEEPKGVVVSGVDPNGPARDAGIRRGDVIIEVDRKEVDDSEALQEVLADADDRALLLIRRGENQLYLTVKRAG